MWNTYSIIDIKTTNRKPTYTGKTQKVNHLVVGLHKLS